MSNADQISVLTLKLQKLCSTVPVNVLNGKAVNAASWGDACQKGVLVLQKKRLTELDLVRAISSIEAFQD